MNEVQSLVEVSYTRGTEASLMLRDASRGDQGQRTTPYDPLPWGARAENEARLVLASAGLLVWMNANEAAAFLGYNQSEFNRLASSKEIPRHKRGAGYRYNREKLDEWLLAGEPRRKPCDP